VPHFEGKTNLIKYTKLRVYMRSHHEEISENATIADSDDSGTVTSRNVQLKITVTYKMSGKAVAGFAVNA